MHLCPFKLTLLVFWYAFAFLLCSGIWILLVFSLLFFCFDPFKSKKMENLKTESNLFSLLSSYYFLSLSIPVAFTPKKHFIVLLFAFIFSLFKKNKPKLSSLFLAFFLTIKSEQGNKSTLSLVMQNLFFFKFALEIKFFSTEGKK